MGKYCGGEKILSPPWFQHCGGERLRRPRRSDAYAQLEGLRTRGRWEADRGRVEPWTARLSRRRVHDRVSWSLADGLAGGLATTARSQRVVSALSTHARTSSTREPARFATAPARPDLASGLRQRQFMESARQRNRAAHRCAMPAGRPAMQAANGKFTSRAFSASSTTRHVAGRVSKRQRARAIHKPAPSPIHHFS